jgi:hypothetical protein
MSFELTVVWYEQDHSGKFVVHEDKIRDVQKIAKDSLFAESVMRATYSNVGMTFETGWNAEKILFMSMSPIDRR